MPFFFFHLKYKLLNNDFRTNIYRKQQFFRQKLVFILININQCY